MTTYVKRTQKDYTSTFKLAVMAEVEAGAMTYTQAQKRYGIQGRATVLVWFRFYKYSNLLENLKITASEQAWVADITYFPTKDGTSYISLITDAFSRKIVRYDVSDNLKTESSVRAYKMAIQQRKSGGLLRHHSDRRIQS